MDRRPDGLCEAFAGEVAENDEDADGVSIASDALRLSGGTIRQAGSTTSDAVIAHTAVAAADAHKIDGVRPTPVTSGDDAPRTSADGSSIILFFSETLSQATAPADSFAVTVDGVPRSVDEASANGAAVTLALESPVVLADRPGRRGPRPELRPGNDGLLPYRSPRRRYAHGRGFSESPRGDARISGRRRQHARRRRRERRRPAGGARGGAERHR